MSLLLKHFYKTEIYMQSLLIIVSEFKSSLLLLSHNVQSLMSCSEAGEFHFVPVKLSL